jgi:hypothetical protein
VNGWWSIAEQKVAGTNGERAAELRGRGGYEVEQPKQEAKPASQQEAGQQRAGTDTRPVSHRHTPIPRMTIGLNAGPRSSSRAWGTARPGGWWPTAEQKSPRHEVERAGAEGCAGGRWGGLGCPSSNLPDNARPAIKFQFRGQQCGAPW